MNESVEFRVFETRSAASAAAADLLAGLVGQKLASAPRAGATLVVSGGSTPGECFEHLSAAALDWSRVTVIPSDERWVDATDPASNEGLIRSSLLSGRAAGGKVLSFFRRGIDAQQAPAVIARDLASLEPVFSAVLLGMG